MLVSLRHVHSIEPSLFGREAFSGTICLLVVEEKDVGGDTGIGREDTARQSDDGVQIELPQQFLLDGQLGIVSTEKEAIR